eukprot:sb/3472012/
MVSAAFDGKIHKWKSRERAPVSSITASDRILKGVLLSSDLVAVSCIDKAVYVYDFRRPDRPTIKLVGHSQAPSGLCQLDGRLVSGSVDGTIRQWDLASAGQCVRVHRGHTHTDKFIGLESHGPVLLCGDDGLEAPARVHMYSKHLTAPIVTVTSGQYEDHHAGAVEYNTYLFR